MVEGVEGAVSEETGSEEVVEEKQGSREGTDENEVDGRKRGA